MVECWVCAHSKMAAVVHIAWIIVLVVGIVVENGMVRTEVYFRAFPVVDSEMRLKFWIVVTEALLAGLIAKVHSSRFP